MNRRSFTQWTGALAASIMLPARGSAAPQKSAGSQPTEAEVEQAMKKAMSAAPHRDIAMLLYPGMYPLDLFGPHAFLAGLPGVEVHLVGKTLDPILAGKNLKLTPTKTFSDCPGDLEVLFVPGGMPGTISAMQDQEVMDFLADRGSRAKYVTSVCTGSLILGAAGLLKGYRATSHWDTRDILPILGAVPVDQRIVEDRNRITGGGVTSGIDFGLLLASRLTDATYAQMLQLMNEYDPRPPFQSGTPSQAGPAVTSHLRTLLADSHAASSAAASKARTRLGLG